MAKPKIFVSHSTLDTPFAANLVADLNATGAQAWMDVNDLGAGNFQERISEALADCEWFLLVLTRNALASDWVRQEVDAANRLKHQKRIKELIFIKAADVEHSELPALWGVFNIFDATADYALAVQQTLKSVGIVSQQASPFEVFPGIADKLPKRSIQDVDLPRWVCGVCGSLNAGTANICLDCGFTKR